MPAFVQEKTGRHDDSPPNNIVFTTPLTGGNSVLLAVTARTGNGTGLTFSGIGGTWTLVSNGVDGGIGIGIPQLWKCEGVTGGSTTITVTYPSLGYSVWTAVEFSGAGFIGDAGTGRATASITTSTVHLYSANDFDVTLFSIGNTGGVGTPTYSSDTPAAWTNLTLQSNNNLSAEEQCAYYKTAAGNEDASRTAALTGSDIQVLSARVAASAPPIPPPPPRLHVAPSSAVIQRASNW